jgi:hypothetical protein
MRACGGGFRHIGFHLRQRMCWQRRSSLRQSYDGIIESTVVPWIANRG